MRKRKERFPECWDLAFEAQRSCPLLDHSKGSVVIKNHTSSVVTPLKPKEGLNGITALDAWFFVIHLLGFYRSAKLMP